MKSEGLKIFQAEAKKLADVHGIDYRLAMKALALAKKRSAVVDATIINDARQVIADKKTAKQNLKLKELSHGKVLRLYSEHLLETLVEQNKTIIELLSKK
jgi:hypothetical protein